MLAFIILLVYSVLFGVYFYKKNRYLELAYTTSMVYFILIPYCYLVINDTLPLPMDFYGTNLQDINYSSHIGEIYMLNIFILVTLPVLSILGGLFNVRRKIICKNNTDIKLVNYSVFVYLLLSIALYVWSGVADEGGHWAKSKGEFMEQNGSIALILVFLHAASRFLCLAIVSSYVLKANKLYYGFVLLFIVSVVDIISTGNRITTLVMAFLLLYILVKRRKYIYIYTGLILIIPFGFIMAMYRHIRSQLYSAENIFQGFINGWDLALNNLQDNLVLDFISGVTESINFNVLISVMEVYGKSQDYLLGSSYAKILVWWVPRSVFANKPVTITVESANVFAPFSDVALAVTSIGESYMNFGFIGVILLPICLVLFRNTLTFIIRDENIQPMLLLIFGFLLFRMAYSDLFIYMIFCWFYYRFLTISLSKIERLRFRA
jgi:hypothetical protein